MARRSPADAAALDPALTQKKRARRRLVGAVVLGAAGAIVLPLVLDSEPRQTITDVEIEIPPRDAPLPTAEAPRFADEPITLPAPGHDAAPPAPSAAPEGPADSRGAAGPDAGDDARVADTKAAEAKAAADAKAADAKAADAKAAATSKSDAKKPSAKSEPTKSAAARTQPVGSARSADAAAGDGTRFALQLGAYANAGSARAQLDKARRTGLRAYTETVKTAQGERTRVRVGPFSTREAAEKARASLKLAGIESAVVDAR